MAGRTCLLVFLCLSAGCWDSHPTQEAGDLPAAHDSGAAASSDQASPQTAKSSPAEKAATLRAPGSPDELGFKHTLKPGPTPPAKSATVADNKPASDDKALSKATPPAKPSITAPAVVADRGAEDDRYAELAPAPPVGNQVKVARTPDKSNPSVGSGPTVEAAKTQPAGNPLRDSDSTTATDQSEAPPRPIPSAEMPAVPVYPSLPPSHNSELFIRAKPDETTAAEPPMPATLIASGNEATAPQPLRPATPVAPSSETAAPQRPLPATPVASGHEATAPQSPLPATPVAAAAEKEASPKEHTAKAGPRTNKNSGVPFDPIKVNGPIFVDWPKPQLALVITGNQEGYLEPCGCAGLDRMKGGMSRRYSLFRQLRNKGWPVVGIDVGGIAKGFGKQAELKFQIAVNAMSEMRYSTATLGLSDLHLPTAEVMALTIPVNAQKKTMFVCGNVGLFDFNEALLPRTQLIAAGLKTIGVTAVLGRTYIEQLAGNTDLKMIGPEKLLNEAVPLLKSRANYLVLLAHTTRKEALELADKYPDFNLVICAEGGDEPPAQAEEIHKGGTKLIVVGEKGMYAVVLGMFDDPQQPLRYQRVPLDSRFPASPEMSALMSAYQDQLKDLGLSGLGIRPLPHPLNPLNGEFVGTDACKKCHEESYRVWKKSPHSRAFATLQNVVPPRNFDPECISCHTVGWHPTKFFPYQSGFLSEKETPKLINVGCENCHGPGQWHVRAENHGTPAEQAAARKSVAITEAEAANPNSPKQNCWSCHDLDNSPEFKFDLYWPFVKHREHE